MTVPQIRDRVLLVLKLYDKIDPTKVFTIMNSSINCYITIYIFFPH